MEHPSVPISRQESGIRSHPVISAAEPKVASPRLRQAYTRSLIYPPRTTISLRFPIHRRGRSRGAGGRQAGRRPRIHHHHPRYALSGEPGHGTSRGGGCARQRRHPGHDRHRRRPARCRDGCRSLERLARATGVVKASRRDLAAVLVGRATAGTTVAATMVIAALAGIPFRNRRHPAVSTAARPILRRLR